MPDAKAIRCGCSVRACVCLCVVFCARPSFTCDARMMFSNQWKSISHHHDHHHHHPCCRHRVYWLAVMTMVIVMMMMISIKRIDASWAHKFYLFCTCAALWIGPNASVCCGGKHCGFPLHMNWKFVTVGHANFIAMRLATQIANGTARKVRHRQRTATTDGDDDDGNDDDMSKRNEFTILIIYGDDPFHRHAHIHSMSCVPCVCVLLLVKKFTALSIVILARWMYSIENDSQDENGG